VKKSPKIAEPAGKLGILLVGMGAVSTTTIAGVLAIRRGLAKPIGSLTQMGTVRLGKRTDGRSPLIKDFVPLASLDDIVFGGWDIFEDNAYEAAKTAGVLEAALLDQVRPELEKIRPMPAVFDRQYVKRLDGPNVKKGANKREMADQVREDMRRFKQENGLERLVMVWCGSTEIYLTESPAHANVAAFEKGLEESDPSIPSSMIYAYAAIKEGIPYANAAPNLSADVPALLELAATSGSPLAGKDLKTGQTWMKTVVAPGLKARLLGVEGWYSTNILGNRDGEVLDDPESFKTKEESKKSVLDYILQPSLYPTSTKSFATSSGSITIPPAATTKRAGTTSTSSAGWAIRCSSRSISCAATASWPRRSCSTSRSSWIWPSAVGWAGFRNGCRSISRVRWPRRGSTLSTTCSSS
jgi:myo-inositol-1-phosphate synthase